MLQRKNNHHRHRGQGPERHDIYCPENEVHCNRFLKDDASSDRICMVAYIRHLVFDLKSKLLFYFDLFSFQNYFKIKNDFEMTINQNKIII